MMKGLDPLLISGTAAADDPVAAPKTLLVFAHPDDETVALGGRMGRFAQAHFVHVSDGAPRRDGESQAHGLTSIEEYRKARHREFLKMMSAAGTTGAPYERLEIPDQEASLCLVQLTRRLEFLLDKIEPELVLTHPYEGGHPDHDACAFAVHHAVERRRVRGKKRPLIAEGAFYHAGEGNPETGRFLPCAEAGDELVYALSPEECERKRRLLECFATQKQALEVFRMDCERFRAAPHYDFRHLPHPGAAWYERFSWDMSAARFCELARQAEESLSREEAA